MTNPRSTIIRNAHQIDQLKQQIEAADPKDMPRLRYQLKELKIIQLWQLSQITYERSRA